MQRGIEGDFIDRIPSNFDVSLKSITSRLTKEEKNEKSSVALRALLVEAKRRSRYRGPVGGDHRIRVRNKKTKKSFASFVP